MRLKVIVFRQHTSAHKLLLKDVDKLQKIFRRTVSYVVNCIRRQRQAVLARLALRRLLHHAEHSLYNVIDIGEVPLAVSIIEYLDLVTLDKLVRKSEIRHVRTSGGAIHREEAESRRRNIVQLAVCMSHQLVALLRRRIERNRVVYLVIRRIRNLLIRSVNR